MKRRCRALIQEPDGLVDVKCEAGKSSDRMNALYRELRMIVLWSSVAGDAEVEALTGDLASINRRRRNRVTQKGGGTP